MGSYIPSTPPERLEMLKAIGLSDFTDAFPIPVAADEIGSCLRLQASKKVIENFPKIFCPISLISTEAKNPFQFLESLRQCTAPQSCSVIVKAVQCSIPGNPGRIGL